MVSVRSFMVSFEHAAAPAQSPEPEPERSAALFDAMKVAMEVSILGKAVRAAALSTTQGAARRTRRVALDGMAVERIGERIGKAGRKERDRRTSFAV